MGKIFADSSCAV